MTLLQAILHATAFRSPLLRTLVPTVALAYGVQAAVAVPSIAAKTETYYDLSGSLTYLSCTAFSLFLPYLRARSAGYITGGLTEYLSAPGPGQGAWFWRQAVLSAAVGLWATRLGTYLFQRIKADGHDSRFDSIRNSPGKFLGAFFAQATWVSLCLLPVIGVNALPRAAFALTRIEKVTTKIPTAISASPYWTDILGIALFVFGIGVEIVADRQKSQWVTEKKEKKHDEDFLTRGLWSKSRHPNYFGESTLWTGIAVAAGGLLVRNSAQVGLGLGGVSGKIAVLSMCAVSPAFVTFLLLKVSGVPLSENKYDKRYGDRKDYQQWKENTPMFVPKLF
ncbi:hypothetical protein BCR34DRAFT_481991 [Clohesyomyces aquaticus]|uniref:Uncharacterized protein n=1 Tax=Clohesyomyces aquaticus TaxID=1231657 RepID=A0A1Y1ZRH3_9PLEO|nr:hypothetical protein BCR34DRAFT_481991 [Clohesyomyces aquaticus]